MNHTKYIFLLAACLCMAASCKKEKTEPRHQNVVTAIINGKPWKAGCKDSPPFGCTIGDMQYYENTGFLYLGASNIEKDSGIGITLENVHYPNNYFIPHKQQCAILVKEEPCGRQRHYIDKNDPQLIEILTIDKERKIIEGRFSFIGRDTNCMSEPIYITKGYFNVKYRP